jgi:hypothetical protein
VPFKHKNRLSKDDVAERASLNLHGSSSIAINHKCLCGKDISCRVSLHRNYNRLYPAALICVECNCIGETSFYVNDPIIRLNSVHDGRPTYPAGGAHAHRKCIQ